jgi:putative phosphoesterase
MLLAAVLSDTHVQPVEVDRLMDRIGPHLRGVDRILHAGDVVCTELLDALGQVAPVDAVAGNMDPPAVQARWPETATIDLDGRRIGLMHGWGAAGDLPRKVLERCCDEDGKPTIDGLVFGHSHAALVEYRQGVLLLNPGSPTDRRWAPFCSMALLEVGRTLSARIVRLD